MYILINEMTTNLLEHTCSLHIRLEGTQPSSQHMCYHRHSRSLEYNRRRHTSIFNYNKILLIPTSIFLGHPALSLTPWAFPLIQCCRLATRVYTTGSRQQPLLSSTHLLNTPAAMYLQFKNS